MRDEQCVSFLQWALPQMHLRWQGFRKVRGQVCKRISRRLHELEIRSLEDYRHYLEAHPEEWDWLDAACRITISRFYRDRRVFDLLVEEILPEAARRAASDGRSVSLWSAGCASGEEPYTLSISWRMRLQEAFPEVPLEITATDVEAHMLERARRGCYPSGTLKELPDPWRKVAFSRSGDEDDPFCLKAVFRKNVRWRQQDIRKEMPDGPLDGILCRNLVFMYFEEELARACLRRIIERLRPGGFLVLGKHDVLPPHDLPLEPWFENEKIYRKTSNSKS